MLKGSSGKRNHELAYSGMALISQNGVLVSRMGSLGDSKRCWLGAGCELIMVNNLCNLHKITCIKCICQEVIIQYMND